MWKHAVSVGALLSICQHSHAQLVGIDLPSTGIMYSASQDMLYSAVPGSVPKIGNTVTQLDPATLEIGDSVFIGSTPFRMVMSDSGNTIYVALLGAPAMTQVDLPSLTNVRTFALGTSSQFAEDMNVQPGTENVLAVSRRNYQFSPHGEGVAIYEDGVIRPNIHGGVCFIVFGDNPSRLYGLNQETTEFGFQRMVVDQNGVTGIGTFHGLFTHFGIQIQYAGGRVYGTNGVVIDPELGQILGSFPGSTGRPMVDLYSGRAIFVDIQGSTAVLNAYNLNTFAFIESRVFSPVQGGVLSAVRWGRSGIAFDTYGNKIYSLQSSIAWKPILVPAEQLTVVSGNVQAGTLASMATSNDQRLVLRPGVVFSTSMPPVNIELTSAAPNPAEVDLSFMIESQASSNNLRQTVYLFDYDAMQWELADVRQATTTDNRVVIDRIGDGNRFIQPGTSMIRAKITYKATGPLFNYPWEARIDTARWTFPD